MHKADSRNCSSTIQSRFCDLSPTLTIFPSFTLVHCWNYRRFAAAKAKATAESELAVTMSLIENDPSNYSAWHYRSILLPRKFSDAPDELSAAISEEFDLIKQAIWTDPSDQSAWLYHHWLVGVRKRTDKTQLMETIEQELGSCDELLAEEPNSRWAILTKILLHLEKGGFDAEALSSDLKKLKELDPLHKNYYESLLSRVNHTSV
jgi:geranylgeranyl transferase type-2 subunit alpha